MTLLLCAFAAIVSTVLWYVIPKRNEYKLGILPLMFWGASLMWLIDAVVEYLEVGVEYFTPAFSDMVNDAYLGASVIALGLVIWLVVLLVKDPKGVVKTAITHKN